MKRGFFIFICATSCIYSSGCLFPISWDKLGPAPVITPENTVNNTYGLDKTVPATMKSKANALQLAAVAKEYAAAIKYDGVREEPILKTTDDIGARFVIMNNFAWKGTNKIATPEFKTLTGELFSKELGNEHDLTEKIGDQTYREKASFLFEAIAFGLEQVKDAK